MTDCKCPNTHCKNHKNCDLCRAHHADKENPPHCERETVE